MTVSFTGHRDACSPEIKNTLREMTEKLIDEGADMFCAGGAVGFDTIAAETVLELQGEYPWITLRLVLPCPPEVQTSRFPVKARERYFDILRAADSTEIISPVYTDECMKLRNQRLVELADVCLCFYDKSRFTSGTGQTVRMAEKKEIEIINIHEI